MGWTQLLGSRRETYYECRHCGTALDGGGNVCPSCGASSIAEYELG